MPLLDRNKFPPGGFPYREPSVNWTAPRDGLDFRLRARQIQAVRIANPAAGLNPDIRACEESLDLYTCTRLGNDPTWCVAPTDPVARVLAAAQATPPRCGGCGHRRARRAKAKA